MRPSLAHDLEKANAQAALGYSLLVFALPHLLQQNQHRHLHVNRELKNHDDGLVDDDRK